MNYGLVIILLMCFIPGIYTVINLPFCQVVEATLVNFEEYEYNNGKGTERDYHAVYKYKYGDWERRYESQIGLFMPFTRKQTKKLYIRKDGKVFEQEVALFSLGAAAILLFFELFIKHGNIF